MTNIRRSLLVCTVALAGAVSAFAQESAHHRLDNFDISNGIRIETLLSSNAPALKKQTTRLTGKSGTLPGAKNSSARAMPFEAGFRPIMTISKSLDGFTTGNNRVDEMIVESGSRNGVDPVLLYAIMHRESAFKQNALSNKGARGLMQLMPGTAARFGVSSIFDPRQNIEGGARYMKFLLHFFGGDVSLALAGYNAGEGAVLKYGRNIPPYNETREYVRRITQRYALMRNPQVARQATVVTRAQIASIEADKPASPVYERDVFAVRLPDGKLRLVSQ